MEPAKKGADRGDARGIQKSCQTLDAWEQLELFSSPITPTTRSERGLEWIQECFASRGLASFTFTNEITPRHLAYFWDGCWQEAERIAEDLNPEISELDKHPQVASQARNRKTMHEIRLRRNDLRELAEAAKGSPLPLPLLGMITYFIRLSRGSVFNGFHVR